MKIRFLFVHGSLRVFVALIAAGLVFLSAGMAQEPPAAAGTAPALRDIAGIWQGTLHVPTANRDLRIVGKISKDDKGPLKVMFYSIDQGSGGRGRRRTM